MSAMKSRNEIEVSNLRKIISDREKTIAHHVQESQRLKNQTDEKVLKKDSELTLLKSTLEELQIELHNSQFKQEQLKMYWIFFFEISFFSRRELHGIK